MKDEQDQNIARLKIMNSTSIARFKIAKITVPRYIGVHILSNT